jgi:serine O-acetyltransferase
MFRSVAADLAIIRERDPAARSSLEILLCYPGFHALVIHRFSHRLWRLGLPLVPRLVSQLAP